MLLMLHLLGRWCWTTSTTMAGAETVFDLIVYGQLGAVPTLVLACAVLRHLSR